MSESTTEDFDVAVGDEFDPSRSELELTSTQYSVLEYINSSNRGVTSPEIAEDLDLPRSTVRDQTDVLVEKGLVKTEKPSSSVRLYFTELCPQWGDYEILTDSEVEYLRTGDTGGVPERVILERIMLALEDHSQEIPLNEAPVKEEIELLAKRGGISDPIETVTFLSLRGGIMRVLPDESELDGLYKVSVMKTPEYMRRMRLRLDVNQGEVAEALAEFGDVTESSYQNKISRWENGEDELLSRDEVSCMVEYLQVIHKTQYDGFSVSPDWL